MNINEIFGRLDKLFAENRISEVERYLTQALSEAEYDGDRETMQAIYNELISFHRSTGEYDKALYFCRQVIRLAEKMGQIPTEPLEIFWRHWPISGRSEIYTRDR